MKVCEDIYRILHICFLIYIPSSLISLLKVYSDVDFSKQESSEIRAFRWKWYQQTAQTSEQKKEEREKKEKEASAPQENQEKKLPVEEHWLGARQWFRKWLICQKRQ